MRVFGKAGVVAMLAVTAACAPSGGDTTSKAKKLVLTHHMKRALDDKDVVLKAIRQNYDGQVEYADDLSCYPL